MPRKKRNIKYSKVGCARVEYLQEKGLSPWGQLVMFELICGRLRKRASANSGLYYPFVPEIIAKNIGIKKRDAIKALKEIESYGIAYYDEASNIIWVPDIWFADYVVNDSHAQGIAREIRSLPDNPFWEKMAETFKRLNHEAISDVDQDKMRKRQAWYSTIQEALREMIEKRDTGVGTCPNTSLISLKYHIAEHKGCTIASSTFEYFMKEYQNHTEKEHPGIAPQERERINEALEGIGIQIPEDSEDSEDTEVITKLIDQFFREWESGELKGKDPTIWLFTTPAIWRLRALKVGALSEEDVFDKEGEIILE